MPELPEVETTVNGISPDVVGQTIKNISINNPNCRLKPTADLEQTVGKKVLRVFRKFKYVVLEVENAGFIIIHLGMSGNLKVPTADAPILKHDHVLIGLDNGRELRYNDQRRFGGVLWVKELADFSGFVDQGVDALEPEFTGAYLQAKSQGKKRPIKQILMDNKIVNGVGNIYANESLYRTNIHPCTFPVDISEAEFTQLVAEIKKVLHESIAVGGTTLKDFQQPDGKPGYFVQQLQCYGKAGDYSEEYDDYYLRIAIGGRSTFFLPAKQALRPASVATFADELAQIQQEIYLAHGRTDWSWEKLNLAEPTSQVPSSNLQAKDPQSQGKASTKAKAKSIAKK